jgi:hypothetical protein
MRQKREREREREKRTQFYHFTDFVLAERKRQKKDKELRKKKFENEINSLVLFRLSWLLLHIGSIAAERRM